MTQQKPSTSILKNLAVAAIMAATATCFAGGPMEEFSREGKFDLYGYGQIQSGDTAKFSSLGGMEIDLEPGAGGGIGVGYHLIDQLSVNTEVAIGTMDLDAKLGPLRATGDATAVNWNLGLDYNILKKRLTPFLTAGLGTMTFNGDFGPGSSKFNETDFAYYVGGGIRWDFTDSFHAKIGYRPMWTTLENSDDAVMLSTVTFGIGMSF